MKTNRRNFFRLLGLGTAAAIIAPKLLIETKQECNKVKLITYNLPNGVKFTLAEDPRFDRPSINNVERSIAQSYWIRKDEWDAIKAFQEQREQKLRKYLYLSKKG